MFEQNEVTVSEKKIKSQIILKKIKIKSQDIGQKALKLAEGQAEIVKQSVLAKYSLRIRDSFN